MNDTSPEMAAKWRELLMQRSGAERVRMGDDMFAMARQIMTASLEVQGYRGVELRKQIFLRTYRNDFTPSEICKFRATVANATYRLKTDNSQSGRQT